MLSEKQMEIWKQMETLNKKLSVVLQLFALQQYFQRQGIMPFFIKTHPVTKQNRKNIH